YIKDFFAPEGPLTEQERQQHAELNRIYIYRLCTLSDRAGDAAKAGFAEVEANDFSAVTSVALFMNAVVDRKWGLELVTEFGQRHYQHFAELKLAWGEVKGRRSGA
ncbi:MAG: hypothetical protein V4773_01910, partial [Verrucomicrobiota bacterium]